ncbi:MAG: Smr/MutS family protein [Ghiorsea sp.]
MDNDEDNLFAQEMGKVQPLTSKERVQVETQQRTKHKVLRGLEEKEVFHKQHIADHRLSSKRSEAWLLRADGVASKDIKKLSQENITYELDLHGLTQDKAVKELADFVSEALSHEVRQICIVHGKGNHSKGKSVLKDTTYHWLESGTFSSFILAAIPAVQSKGGACNVLLRKQKK